MQFIFHKKLKMKKIILSSFTVLLTSACGSPVPTGDTQPECLSDPNCDSSTGSDPDSGATVDDTGDICVLDFDQAAYQCYAFMVPLYEAPNYLVATPYNVVDACTETTTCMPWAGFTLDPNTQIPYAHNEAVFDYCRWECQKYANSASNPLWQEDIGFYNHENGIYPLVGFDCVVELGGANGLYPYLGLEVPQALADISDLSEGDWWDVNAAGGQVDVCPHIANTYQAIFKHPCTNDTCQDQIGLCDAWSPISEITSRLNATTKTYTVSVDHAWLDDLIHNSLEEVYYCDNGRFSQVGTTWKMVNLVSGEMLYVLGFRTNDYDLRIKKTGTTTVYLLNSVSAMVNAYTILRNETALTVSFKRVVGGTATTYTMNITLI